MLTDTPNTVQELTDRELMLISVFSVCKKTTQKAVMKIIRIGETTPDPDEMRVKIQAVMDSLKPPTRREVATVWTEAIKIARQDAE